jgi:hypothetical protein
MGVNTETVAYYFGSGQGLLECPCECMELDRTMTVHKIMKMNLYFSRIIEYEFNYSYKWDMVYRKYS